MADAAAAAAELKLCVVCVAAPRDVIFTAWGHFLLCDGCAAELLKRGAPCPTCRTPVRAVGGTRCVRAAPPADGLAATASFQPENVDPEVRARTVAQQQQEAAEEEEESEEDEDRGWADTPEGVETLFRLQQLFQASSTRLQLLEAKLLVVSRERRHAHVSCSEWQRHRRGEHDAAG